MQQRYELPAFSTLDRLVRHVRYRVNSHIFKTITERLTQQGLIPRFDELLHLPEDYHRTRYHSLKQLPKRPTISHLKALLQHHHWLIGIGNMATLWQDIPEVKLKQFAEQAKSLDASDIRAMALHTQYGLMAALLFQAQQQAKDALATTFCKTVFKLHKDAADALNDLREKHAESAQQMANFLHTLTLTVNDHQQHPEQLTQQILIQYAKQGGTEKVSEVCQQVAAYNSKNHLPLLWPYYQTKRPALFELLRSLTLDSSTQQQSLIKALQLLLAHAHKRAEHIKLASVIDLSFAGDSWQKLVCDSDDPCLINRRYFELCVFTHLAQDLRSGDIYIEGADSFGDYRTHLLPWPACELELPALCQQVGLPANAKDFVAQLKQQLIDTATRLDKRYPALTELVIDEAGLPVLKRLPKSMATDSPLLQAIKQRLPERNLVDILCNTHHYTGWADTFGPLSGSEPKLVHATERYIINTFGQGTGMGPIQTARHVKSEVTAHMLSWINRRHVNLKLLDAALVKLINVSNSFALTQALGDAKRCGADGTLRNIYEDNLMAEAHYRYKHKGGIAYHHVADNYIALFSTFIPCGVWEAIEIIEGLLKNQSDIQPDTIHADTQGQSTPVFGLAYLLDIKLMPRIRNLKDLTFFRPDKTIKYQHIDKLFSATIDWELLETHWQDLMQVVLSIQQGKISSSTLLRKLTNYSRKNRLYQAFQELGRIVRTNYLLEYISCHKLREAITQTTNKVEAYNGLSDWLFFGSNTIVASNDADEMEKAIKYNMLIANAVILQNLVDISQIIYELQQTGWKITKEEVAKLSPYLTSHIKRFGDYLVNLNPIAPIPDSIRAVAFH